MVFKKGHSGNPQGRPKGSLNKTTQQMYECFGDILINSQEQIKEDLMVLDAKDRVNALIKLSDYFVPKAVTNINMDTKGDLTIEQVLNEMVSKNKQK